MSELSALETISRYVPGMAVSDALGLLSAIRSEFPAVSAPVPGISDSETLIKAAVWAECNFGSENANRKIQCIKELRTRFGIGLREGKNIVDSISFTGYGITRWL